MFPRLPKLPDDEPGIRLVLALLALEVFVVLGGVLIVAEMCSRGSC